MLEIKEDIITSEGNFLTTSPRLVFLNSEFWFSESKKLMEKPPFICGHKSGSKAMTLFTAKGTKAITPDGKELFKGLKVHPIGNKYLLIEIDSITYKLLDTDLNEIIPKIIGMGLYTDSNSCVIVTSHDEEKLIITLNSIYKIKGIFYGMFSSGVIIIKDSDLSINTYRVYDVDGNVAFETQDYQQAKDFAEKIKFESSEQVTSFKDQMILFKIIREKLKEMFPEYADNFQEDLLENIRFLESKGVDLVLDLDEFSLKRTQFQKVLVLKNNERSTWIPIESNDLNAIDEFVRVRRNSKADANKK